MGEGGLNPGAEDFAAQLFNREVGTCFLHGISANGSGVWSS